MVNLSEKEKLQNVLSIFNIDNNIIDTCLNRQVPFNNAYWNSCNTYINFSVRFLSIPFWLEICNRLRLVKVKDLLSEKNMLIMESMLHFSEEEEIGAITFEECIYKCSQIEEIKLRIKTDSKLENEINYLVNNYPGYKSLRRGNFLIYYTLLLSDNFETIINTSKTLIDLIICGCVIDDLNDAYQDFINDEDNIVLELGNNLDALNEVKRIFDTSKSRLITVFPELDVYFNKVFVESIFTYITKNNEQSISN